MNYLDCIRGKGLRYPARQGRMRPLETEDMNKSSAVITDRKQHGYHVFPAVKACWDQDLQGYLGFRVMDFKARVSGFGFRVSGLGSRANLNTKVWPTVLSTPNPPAVGR